MDDSPAEGTRAPLATPAGKVVNRKGQTPAMRTPGTPQECVTMVNAVEEAIKQGQDVTPDSAHTASKMPHLQAWLAASGVQLPTPAAKDLNALATAAADNKRLRKQLEALREAELELAAREAEENAQNFAMLEEENLGLAADNARLQQQIAELEAQARVATATNQSINEQAGVDSMQARAVTLLQRAADTRRLSGVFEEEQLASFRQLNHAEEQLSAVKSQRPGSSRSHQAELQQRLQHAEQEVQAAAAAAQQATEKLELVLEEKEKVQQELQTIKQQLESAPMAQQHAELYQKLVDAHQLMQEEKQQHQRLTGSLLEHAGRLSHKYYTLSDDYGALQQRYHHLASTNEQLAAQLKEAHEALYDLQAAVQATPPAKRRQHKHLMARMADAEQAVSSLVNEKSQLQERLLQAQAFIACLQQRPGVARSCNQQQQQYTDTPIFSSVMAAGPTPHNDTNGQSIDNPLAAAANNTAGQLAPLAITAGSSTGNAATETFNSFVTPVKGRSNPLFDLPPTPATAAHGQVAAVAVAHPASFAVEPVSPILAAAAKALRECAGEQHQQKIQWGAASSELQHVQAEQLGLRREIIKAKTALADIAEQLRASIGSGSSAASGGEPASAARSTGSSGPRSSAAAASNQLAAASSQNDGCKSSSSKGSAAGNYVTSRVDSNGNQHRCTAVSASAACAEPANSVVLVEAKDNAVAVSRTLQRERPVAEVVASASLCSGVSNVSVQPTRLGTEQRQEPKNCSGSGRKEFTFPCLSPSEQQHQPLSIGRAANGAPSAAVAAFQAASPCESSGSVSSSTCNKVSKQEQQAAAVASSIARMLEQQRENKSGKLQREKNLQPDISSCSSFTSQGQRRSNAAAARCDRSAGGSRSKAESGSLSLDQLIADAESVSLEYGMSPINCGAVKDSATSSSAPQLLPCQRMPTAAPTSSEGEPKSLGTPAEQQKLGSAAAAAAALAQAFSAPTPVYSGPKTASCATTPTSAQGSVCYSRQQEPDDDRNAQELQQRLIPCSAANSCDEHAHASTTAEQQQLNAAAAAAAALAQAFGAPTPGYSGPMTATWATTPPSAQASVCCSRQYAADADSNVQQMQHLQETPCSTAPVAAAATAPQATPCESVCDSDVDWLLLRQQEHEQYMREQLAQCLADTPGSAASSAGGRNTAAQQWFVNQASLVPMAHVSCGVDLEVTPRPQAGGAADMQSAVKPAAVCSRAVAVDSFSSPLSMHPAVTPAGSERVVSNMVMSEHQGYEDSPVYGNQQQQQQSLLTPSFATPTVIADQRAAAAAAHPYSQAIEDDATSGTRRQEEQELEIPAAAALADYGEVRALQWNSTPGSIAAGAQASGASEHPAAAESAGNQQLVPAVVPGDMHTPAPSAVLPAVEKPSALQSAVTALLASISPAGLISPGEVVPVHVAKHMTPEWLREIKQRCQAGTLQVQQLRQQLNLATPSSCEVPGQQQQEQQSSPAAIGNAAANAEQTKQASAPDNAAQDDASTVPSSVSCRQHARSAAAGGTDPPVPTCSSAQTRTTTGGSARSSIDRLRRLAIVQAAGAAAAAAAEEVTADEDRAAEQVTTLSLEDAFAAVEAIRTAEVQQLEHSDSTGSLAQYMLQPQLSDVWQWSSSGPNSRSPNALLCQRPDCPTPGSTYSLGSDKDAPSPDVLLAGLSSSRLLAKQLQQQLQQQLDRTVSAPAMECGGRHRHHGHSHSEGRQFSLSGEDDGAAAVAAAAHGVTDAEGGRARQHALTSCSNSSQCQDNKSSLVTKCAAEHDDLEIVLTSDQVTPQRSAASRSCIHQAAQASPCTPGAELNAGAESRLLPDIAVAAASPFTPGALLNADAQSCLLSPSMDLERVFAGVQANSGAGDELVPPSSEATSVAVHTVSDASGCERTRALRSTTCSGNTVKAHELSGTFSRASSISAGSITLGCNVRMDGMSATAVEEMPSSAAAAALNSAASGDHGKSRSLAAHPISSIAAYELSSSIADTPAVTAGSDSERRAVAVGTMGSAATIAAALSVADLCDGDANHASTLTPDVRAHPVSLIRAHQLSSLPAGTVTAASSSMPVSLTPASDARIAPDLTFTAAVQAMPLLTALDSSEATNPSLNSWAASGAVISSSCIAAYQEETPGSRKDCVPACIVVRDPPERICLGTSPTSSMRSGPAPRGSTPGSIGGAFGSPAVQASATSGSVGSCNSYSQPGGATTAAGDAAQPGSCCASYIAPSVRLGDSPGQSVDTTTAGQVQRHNAADIACSAATIAMPVSASSVSSKQRVAVTVSTAAPAISSTSKAGTSCMYATPAVNFDSPGTTSNAATSGQPIFYTALQQTARTTGGTLVRRPGADAGVVAFCGFGEMSHAMPDGVKASSMVNDKAAASGDKSALDSAAGSWQHVTADLEEQLSTQHTAAAACSSGHTTAAAAVEDEEEEQQSLLQQLLESPEGSDATSIATGQGTVDVDGQNSLLQQLLNSPGGSSCASPAWGAAADGELDLSTVPFGAERPAHSVCSAVSRAGAGQGGACIAYPQQQDDAVDKTPTGVELASHPLSITANTAAETAATGYSSVSAGGARSISSASAAARRFLQERSRQRARPGSAPAAAAQVQAGANSATGSYAACGSCSTSTQSNTPGQSSKAANNFPACADASGGDKLFSPTLSELGFIDAPTVVDFESTQQLQRQQLLEQQQRTARAAEGDLMGMTFEQRLALLCSSDDSENVQHGVDGASSSSSTAQVQQPQQQEEEEDMVHTPLLPGHVASCATQTSPLFAEAATQKTCAMRDMETQVTPALHETAGRTKAKVSKAALSRASDEPAVTKQQMHPTAATPCDIAASPVKIRDQV